MILKNPENYSIFPEIKFKTSPFDIKDTKTPKKTGNTVERYFTFFRVHRIFHCVGAASGKMQARTGSRQSLV